MTVSVYQIVTDRIIAKLKEGTVPWRKPWNRNGLNVPINYVSRRPYSGVNRFLLDPGEYASFKQIEKAGGKVKKGSKSHVVVFWKPFETEKNGKKETVFFLRYYNVFDIATQTEGLESKIQTGPEDFTHEPHEQAEAIVEEYISRSGVSFNPNANAAFFRPSDDSVHVPPLSSFPHGDEYYSTTFHELVHSTGTEARLSRPGIMAFDSFGTKRYAKEELVAEMGAAMLCAITGIDNSTIENSAAYIATWLKRLQDDVQLVVTAASQAQKAIQFIHPAEQQQQLEEMEEAV